MYYNNDDREIGDYLNDKPIGVPAKLLYNGIFESFNY